MPNVQEIISNIAGGISKKEEELTNKAYNFAEKAHAEQKRMNGDPYFIHVFETAKILAQLGMDAKTIAAGLLHDVLEDTKITGEEIKKEFGKDILFLIKGVTKLGTLKYRGHERHVESLRKFFIAMANDMRVVIIKFADRLHNLRTLKYLREDKRERIAVESIEVYAPLANRLGMGKLKGELEDAAFPYAYPKESAQVEEIIKEKKDLYQKNLSDIQKELKKELEKNNIRVVEINSRMKHKYSLWKKLVKRQMDIEKIYDIVALRVVVENIEECYRVLGIIHSIWRPLPGRIKDYIAVPKPNNYRSIHTTIFTGSGGIAEIQIRTKEMHAEAAYGIAAHFAYKENGNEEMENNKLKFKWIEELKNLHHYEGEPKNFIKHLKMDFFNDRIFIFTPKGDIVEITKKKDAHPSSKWLEYVKTTIAKKHIKSYLEKNSLLSRLKSFGRS